VRGKKVALIMILKTILAFFKDLLAFKDFLAFSEGHNKGSLAFLAFIKALILNVCVAKKFFFF
jgi:hypothetical protein